MGLPAKGSIVVVLFPFSDLSQAKRRPAILLADAGKGDGILCMLTTNAYADPMAISIGAGELASGSFRKVSYARPAKLFTAHEDLMDDPPIATLTPAAFTRVRDAVLKVFA